jgi:hypothetical protein
MASICEMGRPIASRAATIFGFMRAVTFGKDLGIEDDHFANPRGRRTR